MHLSFNTKDVSKKRLGIILYSQDNLKLCCLVLRTERPEGYSTGKLDGAVRSDSHMISAIPAGKP